MIHKGIHFIFATGRHHVDVAQIRGVLGIDAYMITSNGARVRNAVGELVFSHNVDPEIMHDLCLMEFDNADILTNYYCHDHWYMNRERITADVRNKTTPDKLIVLVQAVDFETQNIGFFHPQ